MPHNADDYALVIGIEGYSQLPRLRGAASDAAAFVEWLTFPEGGGLPAQNVQLLLSPAQLPADPMEARPQQWEIDRALRRMGFESGARIGRRLYFYFAGHAFGAALDDVGMLMADAARARLGANIGLRAYRQLLHQTGLFDEFVFIIDASRDLVPTVQTGAPTFTLPAKTPPAAVRELVILAAASGGQAFASADPATGERRGLLTRAVLEGLRGGAANPQGPVTSAGLARFVPRRVAELADGMGFQQQAEVLRSEGEIVFSGGPTDGAAGRLIVELPHWSARVSIFDNLLRPVPDVLPARDPASGIGIVEVSLSPGIYLVEATLEAKSEQKPILIRPDREPQRIRREEWKELALTSSAPLAETATPGEPQTHQPRKVRREKQRREAAHTRQAREWSLKPTCRLSVTGDSRLFIFGRTLEPARFPTFADGLQLLDGQGQSLTGFSEGVRKNPEQGWMAFTADLPPGFYWLRRGRPGLRVRCHPLYLCRGWETQAFFTGRGHPSLRTLTLNMAPAGAGFHPDDETTIAAEAVLDGMRYGGSECGIVASEHLRELLNGERWNPWLGILAGYVLLRAREEGGPSGGGVPQAEPDLLERVLGFLRSTIGDHPDVRALDLRDSSPNPEPFPYPPLLRAGLQRVQRHATRFAGTIPLGSLTERVLHNLLIDSPWTAWRRLAAPPQMLEKGERKGKSRRTPERAAADASAGYARALVQTAPLSAPVFPLGPSPEVRPEAAPAGSPAFDVRGDALAAAPAGETQSAPPPIQSLMAAPLIEVAQQVIESGASDVMPDVITLDAARTVTEILDRVRPEAISAAAGIPLDRTLQGLEHLRQSAASSGSTPGEDMPLTGTEQAIVDYTLRQPVSRAGAAADPPAPDDLSSDPAAAARSVGESLTIEDSVAVFRSVAERLLRRSPDEEDPAGDQAATGAPAYTLEEATRARGWIARLHGVVRRLLMCADFMAAMDPGGRLRTGNGAFKALLSLPDPGGARPDPHIEAENRRAWETALASAPLGRSTLPSPVPDTLFPVWSLKRIDLQDEGTHETRGSLNILRGVDAPWLAPDTLPRIEALQSQVTLFASFFAHGSTQERTRYQDDLEALLSEIEQVLREDGPVSGG